MPRGKFIYADNAATTQLTPETLDTMLPFLKDEFGNPSSLYSFSKTAKEALKSSRVTIAECIGAFPEEIFFTSGGTESDNWALKGTQCQRLLYSSVEHHAVLNSCTTLKKSGQKVIKLPVNKYGQVESEVLSGYVRRGDLVSIMTANNEIGSINDICSLVLITKKAGAIFHTDAVQAVGHIPIDVNTWNVDMLSASAHKFNGPKGIGFLYIRKGTPIRSYLDGGHQESRMRSGTENVASIVGMATALKLNIDEQELQSQKLQQMETQFRKIIVNKLPMAIFNGSPEQHLPGLLNLSLPDISAEGMLHLLDLQGISVSTGTACNSKLKKMSHVLKTIGLSKEFSIGTLRISFGRCNDLTDANAVAEAIVRTYNKIAKL